jgi:hypothetical protein
MTNSNAHESSSVPVNGLENDQSAQSDQVNVVWWMLVSFILVAVVAVGVPTYAISVSG